jgi:hypothetical protein
MTDIPATVERAFEAHDSLVPQNEGATVTTTAFDGVVTASAGETGVTYTVRVEVPTLDAATADEVGDAVAADWLRTLRRRLESAPKATRVTVELDSFAVSTEGETVQVEYEFTNGSPSTAATVATTFVEYVEGTYVEGIVPGYEYEQPVASLLSQASQGGESGTPL